MVRLTRIPRFRPLLTRLAPAIAFVVLLAGCAVIPPPRAALNLVARAPAVGTDRSSYNRSVYDTVADWVEDRYYDGNLNGADWPAARQRHRAAALAATDDHELYAAVNALLAELHDPHTRAQAAAEFAQTFRALAIGLGWRSEPVAEAEDGRRRITEVFPNSPAREAGVREGWIVVNCNGRPPAEVVGIGKLVAGQVVRCTFLTDTGETRTLELAARQITVPAYRAAAEIAPGVFLLRFDRFDRNSTRWLRREITAHRDARALIVDLRGNRGGDLFALGSVLGDLFPHPVEIGTFVHRGDEAVWPRWISQRGGARYAGKLALLVSPETASSSEIVCQLVQENQRGIVVGRKTHGALLGAVFWPLPAGGKLWISVYNYRSPQGTRVEQRGVIPDVPVSAVPDPARRGAEDPVVRAAFEALFPGETLPQHR